MLLLLIGGHILLIVALALLTSWLCVGGVGLLIASIWLFAMGVWFIASYCFKVLKP